MGYVARIIVLCLLGIGCQALTGYEVVFEAEHATRIKPVFQIVEDKDASNGLALAVMEGAGYAGEAIFQLPLKADGLFDIWMRVKWNGKCSNSLYLRVNGSVRRRATDNVLGQWHWIRAGNVRIGADRSLDLRLEVREDGVWIDEILLADRPTFRPTALTEANTVPNGFPAKGRPPTLAFSVSTPFAPVPPLDDPSPHLDPHATWEKESFPTLVVSPDLPKTLEIWTRNLTGRPLKLSGTIANLDGLLVKPSPEFDVQMEGKDILKKTSFTVTCSKSFPRALHSTSVSLKDEGGNTAAQKVLVYRPYDWLVLGPTATFHDYMLRDLQGCYRSGDRLLRWKRVGAEEFTPLGLVDMLRAIAPLSDATAYAYTEVIAEKSGQFVMETRNDDSLTVWLNGQKAYLNHASSPSIRTIRFTPVSLNGGKNTILVKLTQERNYWEFMIRFLSGVRGAEVGATGEERKLAERE